jgi:hypothetical protein
MDWPGSRSRAPAFPWDTQPRRAPVQRGAPDLSDNGKGAMAAGATQLVPVQLGVGAFRAPVVPRVPASAVRFPRPCGACKPGGQWARAHRSVPVADALALPRAQAPPVFFGHGGAAWGAGAPATCGEASEGGSRLTARSVFGFSASEGYAASVSVSHSCAAFGDDGAEVDSGAAHAAQAMPLALQDRAPPGFFDQLGPPPGLEMYYGAGGVARQDHMAVDAAAVVPFAPASRKRSAQDDWAATERPARVFRSVYDTAADHHMDPAFDQVRFLRVAAAFAPLIQALRRNRLTRDTAHMGRSWALPPPS